MADEIPVEDQAEVEERKSPSGHIVYEAILAEADEELARPSSALFWSGLAAGLSMGFSGLGVALLKAHLPGASWAPLVSNFGYCIGFLVAILGRQQLFTENTLTPILPLLRRKDRHTLYHVLRLWLVIFISNIIGALIVAFVFARTSALDDQVRVALFAFADHSMGHPFWTTVLRAVFAGWLVALIVWMLPFAESGRIWIIVILTYIVSLGDFPHIVAGAGEVFALAWSHHATWAAVIIEFIIPTLLGNIIGGVTLVAALNHAQVVGGKK